MITKINFKFLDSLNWLICFLPFILIYSRSIADIVVVICGLYFLFVKIKKKDFDWLKEPWVKIGFIFYLWLIIISFFSYYPELSASRAVGWIRFLIFITALKYLFLTNSIYKKRLLIVISITVIYITLYMIGEFLFILNKTFLLNDNSFFLYGYLRLMGPAQAGGKSAFMLSLLFYPVFFTILNEKNEFFHKNNFLFILIFILVFLCILLSGHRFSNFIFFVSSFFFLYSIFKHNRKIFNKFFISLITPLILIAVIFPQQLNRIIKSSIDLAHNYEKSAYWSVNKNAFLMFKKHPLTGIGLKNYHRVCEHPDFISAEHKKYNLTPWWGVTKHRIYARQLKPDGEITQHDMNDVRKIIVESNSNVDVMLEKSGINVNDIILDLRPPTCFTHIHNLYFSLLAETGFIGFALFLILIFKIAKTFFIESKKITKRTEFGFLIALIPLLIPMIPNLNYFSNVNAILIWFLVGWALSHTNKKSFS